MTPGDQTLHSYPPSYCLHCNQETGYDGWGMGIGGVVDFYCQDCEKLKYSKPFTEIYDRALKEEIIGVLGADEEKP